MKSVVYTIVSLDTISSNVQQVENLCHFLFSELDPTYLSTPSTNNEEDRILTGPRGFLYDVEGCIFVLVSCIKDATTIDATTQLMYTHVASR